MEKDIVYRVMVAMCGWRERTPLAFLHRLPPVIGSWTIAQNNRAFTLLELMLTLAVIGLLAAIAVPVYTRSVESARIDNAIADIGQVQLAIAKFRLNNNDRVADSLKDVGLGGTLDPWGNPYQYLNLTNCDDDKCINPENVTVKARKDKDLKPINTDFDLYTMGKDGLSKQSLTANESQDDVVRAHDGAFIGLASEY